VPSAADDVAEAIAASGPLRFDEFLRLALYGPNGFYQSGGSAGRRGDFLTSPEVGPLFGVVLTRALDRWWHDLGRPDPFTVVEAGAGPGTLARAVTTAPSECAGALRYVAVELSAEQRSRHPEQVESRADLPDRPFTGVVFANELLDNLPFRLLVFDGAWREAFVDLGRDGRPVEVLGPAIDDRPAWLPAHAPHGARVPWQEQAGDWVRAARGLLTAGRVVAIDYVTARTAFLAAMPWREWLRTYAGQERGGHYLREAGRQDITAQVALDQLPEPTAVSTQAQFLLRWGIDDLVEEGRAAWTATAGAPTLDSLRMRSRIREAEALLDPAGLGGFHVLEWVAEGS
jgi:SAM-dependent MidA family methyltransferase